MEKLYYLAFFVFALCGYILLVYIGYKKRVQNEKQRNLRATKIQRCCELEIDCEFCPNNCFKD